MKILYIYILSIAAFSFFKLIGLLHKKSHNGDIPVTKILFVRLDKLGDMCITVPFLDALKTSYPNTEITLLCTSSNAQFLSEFESYFNVTLYDKLIVWDPPWRKNKYRLFGFNDFFSLIRQINKMRRAKYSVVVQPVVMGIETLFSLLIKSDQVFSCIDVEMPLSRCLKPYLDFALERHGNRDFHLSDNVFEIVCHFERLKFLDRQQIKAEFYRVARSENGRAQPNIIINVSAGNSRRNLPYEHAQFILNHLFSNYKDNVSVSLIGTVDDVEISDKLASEFSGVNNLVGKTPFSDLFALLERADLLITPDTGTMHIGSLLNVYMICIFGSGLVPFCRPVSKNCIIVKKELGCSGCMDFCVTSEIPPPCITELDPSLIVVEIDRYLSLLTTSKCLGDALK